MILPTLVRQPLARTVTALVRRARARPTMAILTGVAALSVLALVVALLVRNRFDPAASAQVRRGTLTVRLVESGLLRPAESITYRSPLSGRETEIVFLVEEGTLVGEGDLLVRLDVTELGRELARSVQEMRQAEVELKVAEADREDGLAAVDSVTEGEGSLEVEEARSRLSLAEKKSERLRQEYETLKSLRARGFITQDELDRAAFELEQAEADLALARRKADVFIGRTHPRQQQRAQLQLAQKEAQRENARARLREARERVKALQQQIEGSSIHARAPGLVVFEDFLGAGTRRKIRVGDRVTGSQGLVTIPEVARMVVETSVRESQIQWVRPGQAAVVRLEAFPDLRLAGRVSRVGTLARASIDHSTEEKRFDVMVALDASHPDLRPEMTARAEILVIERTNALLVPVNAVFVRDGKNVCHVLGWWGPRARSVQLGGSNETFAEVLSGLAEGERVSLVDAASASAETAPAAPAKAAPMKAAPPGASETGAAPLGPR